MADDELGAVASLRFAWVLLTMGDRDAALRRAVDSILDADARSPILIVVNGAGEIPLPIRGDRIDRLVLDANVGIPAGRDAAVRHLASRPDAPDVVGFVDDDAELRTADVLGRLRDEFRDERTAAVSFRIVDGQGVTARRHLPRIGRRGVDRAGAVATFLGGGCAIRADAYRDAGGYWPDLFYGHEELELSWRLVDRGWQIRYQPEIRLFHPATPVSRHERGWMLTGRNRSLVARRTLPRPLAQLHIATWASIGAVRAPGIAMKRAFVGGLLDGMKHPVRRKPIRWSTVVKLTRLGRPPIV